MVTNCCVQTFYVSIYRVYREKIRVFFNSRYEICAGICTVQLFIFVLNDPFSINGTMQFTWRRHVIIAGASIIDTLY